MGVLRLCLHTANHVFPLKKSTGRGSSLVVIFKEAQRVYIYSPIFISANETCQIIIPTDICKGRYFTCLNTYKVYKYLYRN